MLDGLVGIVLVRATLRIMMMSHACPVHRGVAGVFCVAMRKYCPLNARSEGLREDKQQKKGGYKAAQEGN